MSTGLGVERGFEQANNSSQPDPSIRELYQIEKSLAANKAAQNRLSFPRFLDTESITPVSAQPKRAESREK
jgi:hypothetical protein